MDDAYFHWGRIDQTSLCFVEFARCWCPGTTAPLGKVSPDSIYRASIASRGNKMVVSFPAVYILDFISHLPVGEHGAFDAVKIMMKQRTCDSIVASLLVPDFVIM